MTVTTGVSHVKKSDTWVAEDRYKLPTRNIWTPPKVCFKDIYRTQPFNVITLTVYQSLIVIKD